MSQIDAMELAQRIIRDQGQRIRNYEQRFKEIDGNALAASITDNAAERAKRLQTIKSLAGESLSETRSFDTVSVETRDRVRVLRAQEHIDAIN
jgi:hypothetical protein